VEGDLGARPLAVAIRGSFESFFKDKASPFQGGQKPSTTQPGQPTPTPESSPQTELGTVTTSPDTARLIVVGSAEFVDDALLNISTRLSQDRYLNNLQFVQNAVDWSVEDEDLLTIRSRGTYARLLKPLVKQQQTLWEGANYVVALLALVIVGWVWNVRQKGEKAMTLTESKAGGAK